MAHFYLGSGCAFRQLSMVMCHRGESNLEELTDFSTRERFGEQDKLFQAHSLPASNTRHRWSAQQKHSCLAWLKFLVGIRRIAFETER